MTSTVAVDYTKYLIIENSKDRYVFDVFGIGVRGTNPLSIVIPGSAAEAAGIKVGEIIKTETKNVRGKPGTTAVVVVASNGQERTLEIVRIHYRVYRDNKTGVDTYAIIERGS